MRITVTLDDDVADAARSLMRTSGKTLGQVVSELARRGLKSRNRFGTRNGLPTFQGQRECTGDSVKAGDRDAGRQVILQSHADNEDLVTRIAA